MNKKFLGLMMTVTLGSTVFTGCGTNKAENQVVQEVEITEENKDTNEEVITEEIDEVISEEVSTEETVTDTEVTEEIIKADDVTQEEVSKEETIVENADDYAGIDPTAAQEMLFVVTDGIELPNRMNMEPDLFGSTYGIDSNVLSSYVVSAPVMNVHATEIAIFEVKDASGINAVKAGIEKRVSDLKTQWENYLPQQYDLVKNYKVVEEGNFILFVISEEADAIVSKFQSAI